MSFQINGRMLTNLLTNMAVQLFASCSCSQLPHNYSPPPIHNVPLTNPAVQLFASCNCSQLPHNSAYT
jgi:hypothetical protein